MYTRWRTNGQGDAADGYPGITGLGPKTAATLINCYGHIESFPVNILNDENRERALLFKTLARLRIDITLFKRVDELRWKGSAESLFSGQEDRRRTPVNTGTKS